MEIDLSIKKLIILATIGSAFSSTIVKVPLNNYENNKLPSSYIKIKNSKIINGKYKWETNLINNRIIYNKYNDEEKFIILTELIKNLSENSIDLDEDIIKMVNKNFWDLA